MLCTFFPKRPRVRPKAPRKILAPFPLLSENSLKTLLWGPTQHNADQARFLLLEAGSRNFLRSLFSLSPNKDFFGFVGWEYHASFLTC